jgi:hypothetical protein
MIDSPSIATLSSMISIPASVHASISASRIDRDASLMSVSPAQKRSNPSLVPGPVTSIATSADTSSLNSSAISAEIGSTVEDPEMITVPLSGSIDSAGSVGLPPEVGVAVEPPEQAATTNDAASVRAPRRRSWVMDTRESSLVRPPLGRPGARWGHTWSV